MAAFLSGAHTLMQIRRLLAAFASALLTFSTVLHAQQTPSSPARPKAGGNWERVEALPANTRLHVTTDRGGKSCRIFAVADDSLTCANGKAAGAVLQRTEIKHIKLTHYVRSTLVGAGVSGGIGAIAGGIAGRTTPCPPSGFCFNIIDGKDVALIFGVGAGLIGGAVGGLTDLARGSSIYVRP